MSKAVKCDLTGKVEDGDGKKQVVVNISERLRLLVTPQVSKDGGKTWQQGEVVEQGAHIISQALDAILGKAKKAK